MKMAIKNKQGGFTLLELMITVAIMGILGTIAVPSYMTYVTKSKRTEAKTEILRIAQLQESYYIQNLTYAQALNDGLGFPGVAHQTESNLYSITSEGLPNSCNGTAANPCTGYSISALPVSGEGQDKDDRCTEFLLDNTGFKGATSSGNSNSRSADTIKECW